MRFAALAVNIMFETAKLFSFNAHVLGDVIDH